MTLERIRVYFDERTLAYDTGSGFFEHPPHPLLAVSEKHPENADRVRNMRSICLKGPIGASTTHALARARQSAELPRACGELRARAVCPPRSNAFTLRGVCVRSRAFFSRCSSAPRLARAARGDGCRARVDARGGVSGVAAGCKRRRQALWRLNCAAARRLVGHRPCSWCCPGRR